MIACFESEVALASSGRSPVASRYVRSSGTRRSRATPIASTPNRSSRRSRRRPTSRRSDARDEASFQGSAVPNRRGRAVIDCSSASRSTTASVTGLIPVAEWQRRRETGLAERLDSGLRNAEIALSPTELLANIQAVQRGPQLPLSTAARAQPGRAPGAPNLDIEMETGTGKTYCYIKTIFEMNKRYGWSKFIIMVPSIAIREGVHKSLQITADHFIESYGTTRLDLSSTIPAPPRAREAFVGRWHQVMVINIQAFAARGADNRRIYEELDDFQSRKPIDVIASNRPILILDEPQKMEGAATMEALPKFKPLMILRYSATHRTQHNRVHRLDALDAYNQKLVKKIAVRGIQTRGLAGTNAYLYLEGIEISKKARCRGSRSRWRSRDGEIKRQLKRLELRDDLFADLRRAGPVRDGFTSPRSTPTATRSSSPTADAPRPARRRRRVREANRRIQIRETIKAHLDKEKQLFAQGIKVLSLFFIDEVVKYRDYAPR